MFCGAGGSGCGAQAAGAKVVAAFDLWAPAVETYRWNFPRTRVWEDPIETISVESVAREIGRVDLILASPECTNHSPAKGSQPRCERSRETAFEVVRFVRVLQPRWIVIENVMQMRHWARYNELMSGLRGCGYQIREQVLNAADFGVPQTRRRLFITCDHETAPPAIAPTVSAWRLAGSVVNRNGFFPFTELRRAGRAANTIERADRAIAELGHKTPFLLVYYGSDGGGGWQSLDVPLRTITTLDRFALVKPSPSGHLMRMLQPPELKAAMGMPPDFELVGRSRREKLRMIGNAVCPPVMNNVVRALARTVHR